MLHLLVFSVVFLITCNSAVCYYLSYYNICRRGRLQVLYMQKLKIVCVQAGRNS